jgi:NhaA family Na+:H+ antiporter
VPSGLKVFLTALAIIDDLGAILVIAVFYTNTLSLINLFIALGIYTILLILRFRKVNNLIFYLVGGAVMWYFMLHSGIHATITGVLLAFAIPTGKGEETSASYIAEKFLHRPVAFFILPLFAFANTGITFTGNWTNNLSHSNSIGIITGLVIGKPLGILLFSLIGIASGICELQPELKWKHIIGAGFLAGIGFTMSVFITLLAFEDSTMIDNSKIAVLLASFVSAIIGFVWLRSTLKNKSFADEKII